MAEAGGAALQGVLARLAALEMELAETRAELAEAKRQLNLAPGGMRDWAGGLPDEVLETVARKVVAQTEAGWAAQLKQWGRSEEKIQEEMAKRKRDGNCPLFVFARVCKDWRKAQLKVGGPLRTRVESDVIMPGQLALLKWALAEGCPRDDEGGYAMARYAARYGHVELVKWLCGEGGFAMDESATKFAMFAATTSGNLELMQWLQGKGYDLSSIFGAHSYGAVFCNYAVGRGHVEVLRWARENGCPWSAYVQDRAAAELGYTDDFGNLWR